MLIVNDVMLLSLLSDYENTAAVKFMYCVPVLNAILTAVPLIEVVVTVEDPDVRRPVAITEGVALNGGVKLMVAIDPDIL